MNKEIKELTLLLLYLTSWKDQDFPSEYKYRRSWKGYPFEILNKLTDENLISGSKKDKSVHITKEGVREAKKLIKKYIDDTENNN